MVFLFQLLTTHELCPLGLDGFGFSNATSLSFLFFKLILENKVWSVNSY